ncbi:MAG: ATP-dependent helicase RecG, partial [Patescibacteria group bacterium]|nr:ATP-dependent helicase RecG [Patescibacteria group bacterium]
MEKRILSKEVASFFRLQDSQKKALKKLQIETVEDLLYHFPVRYGDTSKAEAISTIQTKESVVLFGKITKTETSKSFKTKMPMAKATLEDSSGEVSLVWFNQPYIAKMFPAGSLVRAEGVVSESRGKFSITNPKVESVTKIPEIGRESLFSGESGIDNEDMRLYPVYNESKGITSNWIYYAIQKVLKEGGLEEVTDPIPEEILKKYNLPTLRTALIWIHSPKKEDDAKASRKRFAFEEVFFIQIERELDRLENSKLKSPNLTHKKEEVTEFVKTFPFSLTNSQTKTIEEVLRDFQRGFPMARLLHGDVGSGKTAVAGVATFAVTRNHPDNKDYGHFQVAIMAPTEILARQHFESFKEMFGAKVPIGLITSKLCEKFPSKVDPKKSVHVSKAQLSKWVKNGEISILIGTHALIQKNVSFKNLAFVVIDEQHRFGTKQRKNLARKDGLVPHLLSMSATPIPRTLALTIYGDLDLSLLDEMPMGRKKVTTEVVLPNKREEVYEFLKKKLIEGRQLYIICPRIDEPDPDKEKAIYAKSVKEEAKRLKRDVFPEFEIGILHSKMTPVEKEKEMQKFKEGITHILVATSVVEVGVNVPNATIIIIEGGERFGLSQLHQLRGRVMRSNMDPYCFIFAESKSDKTTERLKAFLKAKNGFELAELDLSLRGPGELSGGVQWGISDIGMEALKNL